MDNDNTKSYSFAETVIAPEHSICSVVLRPFSLGHWSILELYESPFLSESLYPDAVYENDMDNFRNCIRHMLLFLMVCASTYEDNIRLNEDNECFVETKALFEKQIASYIDNTAHWNVYQEIERIKEYLCYYIDSMPEFVETNNPSPPSGIDWKQNLYAIMKNEYGYSESEIMNMSMRRLNIEWVTFAAKNGAIKVKSKQQIESERKTKELVESIRAGKVKVMENGEIVECQPQA